MSASCIRGLEHRMPATAAKIGIRELKAHLSRVVQQAAKGELFAVTDHGLVVASLGPAAAMDRPTDVRERVVASGGIAATRTFDLQPPPRTADWQAIDVQILLDELRGER